MRKLLLAFMALSIIGSCGPQKSGDETGSVSPGNLQIKRGNGVLSLSWTASSRELIAGYNIYVSEEPLVGRYTDQEFADKVKPFNPTPFPGDEDPDDRIEHYEALGLENGIKYYVSVRTVFPDRSLSGSSREIEVVCNPEGEITLSIRYRSEQDGFSFGRGVHVPATDMDNDLYFFSKEGTDYLASPHRLDGFLRSINYAIVSDASRKIGNWQVDQLGDDLLYTDRVKISSGDWLMVRSPENDYTLINILGFAGSGEDRTVKLYYSHSNAIGGELFF